MRPRTIMSTLGIVLLLVAGVGIVQCGKQPATIAEEHATAKKLVTAGDLAGATPHLRTVLALAGDSDPEGRTGTDWFAIGLAHFYLSGEALQKAVAAGGLDSDEQALAEKWSDYVSIAAAEAAITVVGRGERVELPQHIVKGKTTIVDFFSEYCGPCMEIGPYLAKLAQAREDIEVVKIDLNRPGVEGIDWGSPTAQQFGLDSIPHFKIYGPEGTLESEGTAAFDRVVRMITEME